MHKIRGVLDPYGELRIASNAYCNEHVVFQLLDGLLEQTFLEPLGGREMRAVAAKRKDAVNYFLVAVVVVTGRC